MVTKENDHIDSVYAVVLGNMQDGGLPHAGCRCKHCTAAFLDPAKRQFVASLAVVDARQTPSRVWIIDVSPDVTWQLELLSEQLSTPLRPNRLRTPDGVFLTHAHMGHVGGLQQFGREAMSVHELPVYASGALSSLLQQSALLGPTVERFLFSTLEHGVPIMLAENLTIEPLRVPHRDEWGAGTFAFRIQGPGASLLYLPDIDSWTEWEDAPLVFESVDVACIDACFYSAEEIGGRTDVPHPFVNDTMARFSWCANKLVLTHLNHTNPLLDRSSAEVASILDVGARIAHTGMVISLC